MSKEKQPVFAVIMVGGEGTRLSPYSEKDFTKPLLPITNEQSLLQNTCKRVTKNVKEKNIFISTTYNLQEEISRQLPNILPENLIIEPESRNTLAAIAYISLTLSLKNSEAIIASIPSDHVIEKNKKFNQAFNLATQTVKKHPEKIVFLGIKPKNPETSLGYIKSTQKLKYKSKKCFEIESFHEKPNLEIAQNYYNDPKYSWNTANYFYKNKTMLKMIEKYEPETHQIITKINQLIISKEDNYQQKINDLYLDIPQKQIADAIFSKPDFKKSLVIPVDINWADLGTWKSIYDFFLKNENKYQENPVENFNMQDRGCLILNNTDKPVTTIGLKKIIVVYTPNGTLVVHKNELSNIDPYLKTFGSVLETLEFNNESCQIINRSNKPILTSGLKDIIIEQTSKGLVVAKKSKMEELKQKVVTLID